MGRLVFERGQPREPQPTTRAGSILPLLLRPEGATVQELVTYTGKTATDIRHYLNTLSYVYDYTITRGNDPANGTIIYYAMKKPTNKWRG